MKNKMNLLGALIFMLFLSITSKAENIVEIQNKTQRTSSKTVSKSTQAIPGLITSLKESPSSIEQKTKESKEAKTEIQKKYNQNPPKSGFFSLSIGGALIALPAIL